MSEARGGLASGPGALHAGEIRTIFFDIGGVLLTNGLDAGQSARALGPLGVDLAAYQALHERENWFWERGLITAEEFFGRTVIGPNPQLDLSFEAIWERVCAESRVLHAEVIETVRELHRGGAYRVATLNNESRELNNYRLDAFGLRECFDYFICSGYVGEMKPAAGIYRAAIEISGRPAATALFIDDKAENCAAARALGMQAIRFETPAQLTAELAQYGIQTTRERQLICS